MLGLGYKFLDTALQILLGATGAAEESSRESLTEVELTILQSLIEQAERDLRNAFEPRFGANFQRVNRNPVQTEQLNASEQAAIVLTADIAICEVTDILILVIPSILIRLVAEPARSDGTTPAREALLQALELATVQVDAALPNATMRLGDLMLMETGMVLELPHPINTPLECRLNGVAKLRGELVRGEKSLGLQIDSWLSSDHGISASTG